MFKYFSDSELRIILKLILNMKVIVDVLLHHKTKQELIFYIDDAKADVKAVF